MQKNNYRILGACLVMCLATGMIVHLLSIKADKKIAVVDAVKLFDSYNMKKELESREKSRLQNISNQLDSLGNKLNLAHATKNEQEEKSLSAAYAYLKQKLQTEYAQGNQDINAQVWKRLNPVLEEYGKKNKFHLIIGANGMGSVLYTDDFLDKTKEVIQFVNKRYEEGN